MRADVFDTLYKNGDIIIVRQWIVILKGLEPNEYFPDKHPIVYYALAHLVGNTTAAPPEPSRGIGWIEEVDESLVRLATNKEKHILFDKLNNRGVRWDESLKQLIFTDI